MKRLFFGGIHPSYRKELSAKATPSVAVIPKQVVIPMQQHIGECWKLALVGGIVFTAVTWLFSSMVNRLASGAQAKAAPLLSALGLYLAVQCFAGILL